MHGHDSNKEKYLSYRFISFLILCFIPVIGGILGAVTLIMGLGKKTGKGYLILATVGVCITIFITIYLNYSRTHRGPFDTGRIELASKRLGIIKRKLEYYRIIHEEYPEKLTDIEITYEKDLFLDPIQEVNAKLNDPFFFYKKVENKYFLFSRGFDGTPFTNDDVYP